MAQSVSDSVTTSSESALGGFRPSVMYTCYFVADIERALAFYVGVLGMKEQMRIPIGGGVQEAVLGFPDSKGAGVILMWSAKPDAREHGNGYNRLVLRVSDVDAATGAVRARGVRIEKEPTDAPGLRYSLLRDPDGYVIELLELRR